MSAAPEFDDEGRIIDHGSALTGGVWDYRWFRELSFDELQRLRASVRRVHMKHYPVEMVSDHEADKIIASLGPAVAEKLIKSAVDGGHAKAKTFSFPVKM